MSLSGPQPGWLAATWALETLCPAAAQRCPEMQAMGTLQGIRMDHLVLAFVFPGLSILTLTPSQVCHGENTNCTPGL